MEERLKTAVTYKVTNSQGVETIKASIEIADQSPKSASELLLAVLSGISTIPQAQVK